MLLDPPVLYIFNDRLNGILSFALRNKRKPKAQKTNHDVQREGPGRTQRKPAEEEGGQSCYIGFPLTWPFQQPGQGSPSCSFPLPLQGRGLGRQQQRAERAKRIAMRDAVDYL